VHGLGEHHHGALRIDIGDLLGGVHDQRVAVHDGSPPHRELSAQMTDPGAELGIGGVALCLVEQRGRAVPIAGQPGRFAGLEEQLRPGGVGDRQPGAALERRRGDRVRAALSRAGAGLPQRAAGVVVGADRCGGQVPGAPVELAISESGRQRRVRLAAFLRGRRGVHRGARERMAELDLAEVDRDQPGLLRRCEIIDLESDALAGAPEHAEIAAVVRGRQHEHAAGWLR
jgi:hypothetical protein